MSTGNNIFTAGVVRLIVILSFLFALIFLFRNDISRTMERGCFNLSLDVADAGIHLSDQKLCTSQDLEQAAESLVNLGAENVGNEAEKVFEEYEGKINELAQQNNKLANQVNRYAEVRKQYINDSKEFAEYLTQVERRSHNSAPVTQIKEQYSKSFGIDFDNTSVPTKVAIVDPTEITKSTIMIRSDFQKKSKTSTKVINDNLKVKK